MISFLRSVFKTAVLFEAGAAIIFFGSLIHDPQIEKYGAEALQELQSRGYRVPTNSDPVRVYPAEGQHLKPLEAGGWRPGVVLLRPNPLGTADPKTYLRHELMHESSFRTCEGRLPLWAEEAAAIDFSGELAGVAQPGEISTSELERLREKIRIGAPFDAGTWLTLKKAYYQPMAGRGNRAPYRKKSKSCFHLLPCRAKQFLARSSSALLPGRSSNRAAICRAGFPPAHC